MAQNLRDLSYKVRSTNIATIFHTWKMGTRINIYFSKSKTARWGWKIIQIWKIDDLVFLYYGPLDKGHFRVTTGIITASSQITSFKS